MTLPADVRQVDDTGFVWSFLDEADEPERVQAGALIVAGDPEEPFLALVVDVVSGPNGRSIVHLDVVGIPAQAIDELRQLACCRSSQPSARRASGGSPPGWVARSRSLPSSRSVARCEAPAEAAGGSSGGARGIVTGRRSGQGPPGLTTA
jgi:hypothetical protein